MSSSSGSSNRGTKARAARLAETDPATRSGAKSGSKSAKARAGTGSGSGPPAATDGGGSEVTAVTASPVGTGSTRPAGATSKAGARGRSGGRRLDPDRLAALAEERDFLLGSLRDLEAEHEAGDVDDRDYASLADDYTARAAAAIRAIETEQINQRQVDRPRSRSRRILVAALVVVFSVGAGVLVAQWSGTRSSGDSITGGIRGDTRDELVQARQEAADQQYLDAIKDYGKVLQLDPANTEALAYRGWMLRLVALSASGQQQSQLRAEALASLQQALRTNAKDPTSLVFLSVLLGDLGRPADALAELAKVPAGQIPSFMSGTVDQFKAQMQAQLGSTSASTSTSTSTSAPAAPTTTG